MSLQICNANVVGLYCACNNGNDGLKFGGKGCGFEGN